MSSGSTGQPFIWTALKNCVSFRSSPRSASVPVRRPRMRSVQLGGPRTAAVVKIIAAQVHGMGGVARRERQFGGHGLERGFDDVAAKPHAAIALVDAGAGLREDIARLLHLAADADAFEDVEGGLMDGFDLIIGDDAQAGSGLRNCAQGFWTMSLRGGGGALRAASMAQAKLFRRSYRALRSAGLA